MENTLKVLCVYPPMQLMRNEMPRVDGSLGNLYLVGALREAGFEVDLLDATVGSTSRHRLEDTFYRKVELDNGLIRIGLSEEELCEVIAQGGYNMVCVSSIFTPQTRMALSVVRAAKAVSPEILVVAGGVNARSLPERFFDAGTDLICATEGDRVIVKIARALQDGASTRGVSGTMFREASGRIVRLSLEVGDVPTRLDDLPFPAWDMLPLTHYDVAVGGGRAGFADHKTIQTARSLSMMTSRGCPFECLFCHVSIEKEDEKASGGIGKLRLKSHGRILEEVARLKSLGVAKVYLEDDSLLAKKTRIKEIFGILRVEGLQLADVNGVNLVHFLKGRGKGAKPVIDRELLELLFEAGMKEIVFPVESASQRIVKKYATGKLDHDILDVVELVRVAKEVGIKTPINMMIGFPDETEDEMRASIELGRRLVGAGAPYCSIYIVIPFPGSVLFNTAIREGYLDRNFNTDLFNWRIPVMQNTTVLPERIAVLQSEGWKEINPPEYVRARLQANIGPRIDLVVP